MNEKTKEVLQKVKINNNQIKLPNIQLDRKEYMDIKKELEKIGGKWKGGKTSAFVFNINPKDRLEEILKGKKINIKQDFQFFETPSELVKKIIQLGEITPEHSILEPSAGQGAIIEQLNQITDKQISFYEALDDNLCVMLDKNLNSFYKGTDFLQNKEKFDRIIANPPFKNNQDIDHLKHMYNSLKKNGIVVCITSTQWVYGKQTKQIQFRNWLNQINAEIIDVEEGAFKTSGTNIPTKIIKIKK
jgi:hypothetical protein